MLRSLSSPGLFFFPHLCSSLPFFEITLKLNSFERDVLAADNSPLCGLHYTRGFSCEKHGGSKKCVGARTGNSRIPMKITVSHFYHLTFPIIFNLAEFYLIIASFEFFKS